MSERYDNDDPQAEKFRKLFIGGLNYETTEETIKRHFEQFGELTDCVVMKNPETKKSRGFGFITYKTAEMLDKAQNNRPHKLDNRELDTKRAMPRRESNESQSSVKKIFVGGLKDDVSEDDVREVFGHFGKIDKLEMIKDKNTGKQKGFCFITFDDFDSVDKCVLRRRISLGGKYVEVKKAFPKARDDGMGGGRGRGGFRGGMRGRGGFGANSDGYNSDYGYQGDMGNPGNMGGGGGPGGYWGGGYQGHHGGNPDDYGSGGYQGYGASHDSSTGGGYGGSSGGFYDGHNLGSGYGSGNGGGPFRDAGYTKRGAGPYGRGRGSYRR